MQDKGFFDIFSKVEPVNKGWSEDKKYCVTKADGMKYMLRISPGERYEKRKTLFEMLERVAELGIPMCMPIEFGTCKDGVYILESWIDGEDAEATISMLPITEQYVLGLKSGEILRKIHSISAPETQEDWAVRFNRKTNNKIQKYRECGIRFAGDDRVVEYIENNRHLLENRPQSFQHGDYHIGNMMLEKGELRIIDFDRFDFGDPWEEFNRIVWCAAASPYFATGQLRGYFGGEPPMEFFRLLAFYIASNTLSSIYWAIPFGQNEIDTMMKQSQDVLSWFNNMQNPVPTWYLKNFHVQWIDGVLIRIKNPYNFDFIHQYGTVFRVIDGQSSGNLCFGVEKDGRRYFIKFAGAETINNYNLPVGDAIARLKAAVPKYRDLAHPLLINLVKAEEIGGGFTIVFDWEDGESFGDQNPSLHERFLTLLIDKKMGVFEEILRFHEHVAQYGYVAIDFNDNSVLYNFSSGKVMICDIDFYAKQSYINGMGRVLGDEKIMSPEEFRIGGLLDEVTNVYTMGATAFALFSDYDRSPEKWLPSKELYNVAKRAVSDERSQRQQSIRQLIEEWEAAK
ncbi:MAG: phosphotransferase [Clostridiaceae bacterium]